MRSFSRAIGLLALVLAGCDGPSAPSPDTAVPADPEFRAVPFTENARIPIDVLVFVPCANAGSGEFITLSGSLHVLFHITSNDAGHLTIKTHVQPQGISGVGEITGAKYQGTGVTQDIFTARIGFEQTLINNFRLIGQGPGNNFLVHQVFHVTVNANGQLTSLVDKSSIECK